MLASRLSNNTSYTLNKSEHFLGGDPFTVRHGEEGVSGPRSYPMMHSAPSVDRMTD